ncbi:MAG TPA: hypothetical protein VF234_09645 [Limnochordia bacterium]
MKLLERIDRKQPWISFAYTGLVTLAAIAYCGVKVSHVPPTSWGVAVILAVAVCAAELLSVPLPKGNARVSISLSILVAAALLLGPGAAAVVAGSGVLLANLVQQ